MGSRFSTTRPSKTRPPKGRHIQPTQDGGSSGESSESSRSTVLVGRVRRPHGIRGEVLVEVLTDVADRFSPGSELLMGRPVAGSGSDTVIERSLRVATVRGHRDDLLVRFEGLEGRDAVEELRGMSLEIETPSEAQVQEGVYFHYQLLGCRCRDRRSGDLGEVVDLLEDGGGLILVVEGAGRRVPVPFVASFLVEIDVEAGRIEVDLPPGLVETCASRS